MPRRRFRHFRPGWIDVVLAVLALCVAVAWAYLLLTAP